MSLMDITYKSSKVQPFRFLGLMWRDDTIALRERGDTRPVHGALLHQGTYYLGILRVDVPDCKIEHWSATDPPSLCSPTPAAVARHAGRAWVMESPKQREEALAGDPEIQASGVLRYMGIDMCLKGTPTAPHNLPEVRVEAWKQLHPERLSPHADVMPLMVKLRVNYSLRPAFTAPRPQCTRRKHMTGISRHAHTDAL